MSGWVGVWMGVVMDVGECECLNVCGCLYNIYG